MMSDEGQIHWAIKEIRELEYVAEESYEKAKNFDFNYNVAIQPHPAEDILKIIVSPKCMKTGSEEAFLKCKILTTFLIKDLKLRAKKMKDGRDAVDLPEPLWVTLFSIAYTHTRAIFAKSSAGSKFGSFILPPINPSDTFQKLFKPLVEDN